MGRAVTLDESGDENFHLYVKNFRLFHLFAGRFHFWSGMTGRVCSPSFGCVRSQFAFVRVESGFSPGWVRGGLSFCSRDLPRFFSTFVRVHCRNFFHRGIRGLRGT